MSLIAPSVEIELDLIWALSGQQDVVGLVEHLGDQLTAIHVKDGVVPASNPCALEAPAFDSTSLDQRQGVRGGDRKSTRLNSSHVAISYAVFCLKKKKNK